MSHPDDQHRARVITSLGPDERPRIVAFWGHTPKRPGQTDKSCLSQWYPAPFVVDGVRYATAEHFMMAGKARLFGDDAIVAQILADDRPAVAKKLGREVMGFEPDRWEAARFDLVVEGSAHKFGQHKDLGRYLAETGDKVLVEASPTDAVWGVGLAADDPAIDDPRQWPGLNLLGFALMAARKALGR